MYNLFLERDGIYQWENQKLNKKRRITKFPIDNNLNNNNILDHINYWQNAKFWDQKADSLLFIVYDPHLEQEKQDNLYFIRNKIYCYCYQILTFFQDFRKQLQIVIKSEQNHIRYNFKDSQIISTLQALNPKYLNLFNRHLEFTYQEENLYSLIHYRRLLTPYVINNIERLIMNVGLMIYYCEEKEHTVYYGQLNEQHERHGRGIEFKTKWENCNPQYSIIQGSFRNGKKNGKFIKFAGRSKNLQQLDEYENDNFIKTIEEYYPDGSIKVKEEPPPVQAPRRRIVIMDESGVQLNTQPVKDFKIQETKVKYNQQYGHNDEKILANRGQWMNSSIIDGMVMHLLKVNYEQYIESENPLAFNRVFVVDSSHFTNAMVDYKLATSLRCLLYECQGISIFDIYKKIAVVINSNNTHWLSTQVKREQIGTSNQYNIIFEIMDSMAGSSRKYIKYCQTIFNMFKYHLELGDNYIFNDENIIVLEVLQQKDGYSCGDHTCYFIKQMFDGFLEQKSEEVKVIRNTLYDILIK